MPTYTYKDESGKTVELFMTISEMEERQQKNGTIEHEGQTLKRTYSLAGLTGLESNPGWPIESNAAAIPPKCIPEWTAHDKKHGVPTEYTRTGEPILRDRNHRSRWLKAHGFHDRDGGYGD